MSDARHPRHASRRSRVLTMALPAGLIVTLLGSLWALTDVADVAVVLPPPPAAAAQLPSPELMAVPAADPCADQTVIDALAAGDDEAAIVAFGGGDAFRAAVVSGNAPCISLTDATRRWVVVNKAIALDPIDFEPSSLTGAPLRTTTLSSQVREDASAALNALATALSDSGAGVLGMNNGYRSYRLQTTTYAGHVSSRGQVGADQVSARPGYSEHQTGLAMDVVSCGNGCGSIAGFAGTSESDWVAEHAWEYGFVVRYDDGETGVTGYIPEPWHLRYIGPELAAAYHQGGYRSLEEFFGLPAAPDYVD